MATKREAIGVCDFCKQPFPSGIDPYTSKGKPRLYCSTTCRATANSRAGSPIRSRKIRERIQRGEWQNPLGETPEQVARALRARNRSARHRGLVSAARRREVREGTWRNPANTSEARSKLSRPRVHTDDPVLHRAIERLHGGERMADITPEQQDAYRAYRHGLREKRVEAVRRWYRRRYHQLRQSPAGRAKLRVRWARAQERESTRPPNLALRTVRLQAGLSQAELARRVGVSAGAVSKWERSSTRPNDTTRRRVADVLGMPADELFPTT